MLAVAQHQLGAAKGEHAVAGVNADLVAARAQLLDHGGGVGMGYSQHAGVVIVADGTDEAAARLNRVLWNDPATGVMRHADAGYEIALDCAREKQLNLPGILG